MASFPLLAISLPTIPVVPWWIWTVLVAACTVATVTDLQSMRIPNWLTLPLLVAGVTRGGIMGGLPGTGDALAGAAFACFIFVAAYAFSGGGAGDAKLMMALGSWIGLDPSMVLVLAVALAGFVMAIVFTVQRGGLKSVPVLIMNSFLLTRFGFFRVVWARGPALREAVPEEASPTERPKNWFPYAPSILLGALVTWWFCSTFGKAA